MSFQRLVTILVFAFALSNLAHAQTCNRYFSDALKQLQNNPDQLQQVSRSNKMGVDFMTSSLKVLGVKNSMFSAVSLQTAVGMLVPAARGGTQKLVDTFLFSAETHNLGAEVLNLQTSLITSPKQEQISEWYPTPTYFKILNSAWSTSGESTGRPFVFSSEYINALKENFGAEIQSVDFRKASGADAINEWAKRSTEGLIPSIIDAETLSPMTWALLNAAYFEGGWAHTFQAFKADYEILKFQPLEGPANFVDSIKNEKSFRTRVVRDQGVTVEIPFSGEKYSLIVVLPAEAKDMAQTIQEKGAEILQAQYEKLLNNPENLTVDITLPKFSFDTSIEMRGLDTISQELGLSPLFSDGANFGSMPAENSPIKDTKVGLIKQNTRVELDEKGMKAAAVTLIGGLESLSVHRPAQLQVKVDRTFLFAIVENTTNTVLFNGVVTDPSQN